MSDVPPPPSMNYQTPPSPQDPAAMVKMPALLLLITGAIGIVLRLILLLLNLIGVGVGAAAGGQQGMMNMVSGGIGVVFAIISVIVGVIICLGAFKMQKLQSYNLAMAAAVCGLIPCISPCCVITIPFGIWALVVLMKPEVKAAFTK